MCGLEASSSATSASQINLAWTDNASNESGFKIERATAAAGPFTQLGVTTTTSFSDTGLTGGTTYYYRVRAYNVAVDSTYSTTASATFATISLMARMASSFEGITKSTFFGSQLVSTMAMTGMFSRFDS